MNEWPQVFAEEPDDSLWRLDHSTRRYRVRPWRHEDGHSDSLSYPSLTVVDFQAGRRYWGLPSWWSGLKGWTNTDAYADRILSALNPLWDHFGGRP